MPIYEYECQKGHKHERLRPMSDSDEDSVCPECGQQARRLMSVSTFQIDFNSVIRKMTPEEAPNDAGYHPKWDKFTP